MMMMIIAEFIRFSLISQFTLGRDVDNAVKMIHYVAGFTRKLVNSITTNNFFETIRTNYQL